MSVSPFKLINESELLQIKSSLQGAVDRWRDKWFGDAVDVDVAAMQASKLPRGAPGASEEASRVQSLGGENWVAAFAGRRFTGVLAAALAGRAFEGERSSAATPLIRDAADRCLAALCDEIVGGPADPGAQEETKGTALSLRGALRAGSGAAAAIVEIGGERASLILGRELVLGMIAVRRAAPRGGLATRAQSIRQGKVRVRVVAGAAELDVSALCSVAPGDVILLDTSLDAPFGLVNAKGLALARGYLGTREGRKAFQLTS
jgi:flagellar motor switch/type III secretory pathway protein FliN